MTRASQPDLILKAAVVALVRPETLQRPRVISTRPTVVERRLLNGLLVVSEASRGGGAPCSHLPSCLRRHSHTSTPCGPSRPRHRVVSAPFLLWFTKACYPDRSPPPYVHHAENLLIHKTCSYEEPFWNHSLRRRTLNRLELLRRVALVYFTALASCSLSKGNGYLSFFKNTGLYTSAICFMNSKLIKHSELIF